MSDFKYGDLGRQAAEYGRVERMKAQAASAQRSDIAATAAAARDTKELLSVLVQHAVDAESRERTMLKWTRISGVAAIVAVVVGLVGIGVSLLLI